MLALQQIEDHPAISSKLRYPKNRNSYSNIIKLFSIQIMKSPIFTVIYVTFFISYFSVIKAINELKLLVEINCCKLKNT